MGKVVSIDRIRQLRREGILASGSGDDTDGDGTDHGPSPTEFAALMDLFQLARDGDLVSKVSILPTDEGFLFRAYSMADPYYALFEIHKIRNGKWFEYQGRARHQLISVEMGFFKFMDQMRAEIERLVSLFGM